VCLIVLVGNILLEDAPILVPFFPLSGLFDLLAQEMDLLVHLENMMNSDSIDALIGQFGDLFKRCDILIRIEKPRSFRRQRQSNIWAGVVVPRLILVVVIWHVASSTFPSFVYP